MRARCKSFVAPIEALREDACRWGKYGEILFERDSGGAIPAGVFCGVEDGASLRGCGAYISAPKRRAYKMSKPV